MDLRGIEVRDIPNPWVDHMIHEVYFDDVAVPASCRLGEENKGWEIVRQVLANERVGVARHECAERTLDDAIAAAESAGIDVQESALAEVIGSAFATCEAARAMNYAAVSERATVTGGPRPVAAVSRALTGPMEGSVARACLEVLGERSLEHGSAADRQLAAGTTAPIAAGSLEVQLNLVARQVLNLPKG
jgi:alkylation response protein AidB-like acyl-CoA dehydrogenase